MKTNIIDSRQWSVKELAELEPDSYDCHISNSQLKQILYRKRQIAKKTKELKKYSVDQIVEHKIRY